MILLFVFLAMSHIRRHKIAYPLHYVLVRRQELVHWRGLHGGWRNLHWLRRSVHGESSRVATGAGRPQVPQISFYANELRLTLELLALDLDLPIAIAICT